MIFVTTGQRIAVENFSKGVIYKVTFTDESISYMMCVGIGKDFVMLQSTDPLLFSLTMQSASRVSTIDVHDPTPPEPPTPIENALQYQTGEPPFTFTTTENSLFSWYIEGEAGVKTANLFSGWTFGKSLDASTGAETINGNGAVSDYISVDFNTNPTYMIKPIYIGFNSFIAAYNSSNQFLGRTAATGRSSATLNSTSFTSGTPQGTGDIAYIRITCYKTGSQTGDIHDIETIKTMAYVGTDDIPYEPYGFKISISTNEHTTTIYLDEPIAEGEKLYSVNVDAQIVTDIGENTLSVSDPQPPEMQIVYGIYAEA